MARPMPRLPPVTTAVLPVKLIALSFQRGGEGVQIGAGLHGVGPVSYTHLDVYKRQLGGTAGREEKSMISKILEF